MDRRLQRRIARRKRSLERAAARRRAPERDEPASTPAAPPGWSDTVSMVARLRRTMFRRRVFRARQLLRPASAVASFALVVAAVTPSLAHWVEETAASLAVNAGNVDVVALGDLTFNLEGCVGGTEPSCHRVEDGDLAGLPVVSRGEAEFRILEWIDAFGDDGGDKSDQHVGFVFELIDGTVDLTVKSGNPSKSNGSLYSAVYEDPGVHMWLNPACDLDESTGVVECDPENTAAISYVDICLSQPAEAGCAGPAVAEVVVENRGTIPVTIDFSLADPAELCPDGVSPFDMTVAAVPPDGEPPPEPAYVGSLCFLELAGSVPLLGPLDPGDSRAVRVELALGAGVVPPPDGIDLVFDATFSSQQWNTTHGWHLDSTFPLEILAEVDAPEFGQLHVNANLPPNDDGGDVPPGDDNGGVDPPPDDGGDDPPGEDAVPPPENDQPPPPPEGDKPPPETPEPAEFTGTVWLDDGDGIRQTEEPGVEGAKVSLHLASDRSLLGETVTGADGTYVFAADPGSYLVRLEALEGQTFVDAHMGADPTIDSDVVEVWFAQPTTFGWTDPFDLVPEPSNGLADAGLLAPEAPDEPGTGPPILHSIGGVVWLDDGDGIRIDGDDTVDPPIAGEQRLGRVAVALYDDIEGEPLLAAITADDGLYSFDVESGSYWVRFLAPPGHSFTRAQIGDDTLVDSDVASTIEGVAEGGTAILLGWTEEIVVDAATSHVDAGLVPVAGDEDPPGEDEPPADGDEPPVSGDDPPVDDDPPVGDEDPPGEDEPPADSDEPPAESDEPVLITFSGVIWFDDGDGIRIDEDPTAEPGSVEPELRVKGATVVLYDLDRTTVLATAESDAEGIFEFAGVEEGRYLVRVEPIGGFTFTRANPGGDEELDSDIIEIEEILDGEELVELYGWTAPIEVTEDVEPGLVDAGLVPLPIDEDADNAPPAEDPGEVAVEPPETPGAREDDLPDDPTTDDDTEDDERDNGAADEARPNGDDTGDEGDTG